MCALAAAQASSLGAEVEYVSAPREYEVFQASPGAEVTEEPAESGARSDTLLIIVKLHNAHTCACR